MYRAVLLALAIVIGAACSLNTGESDGGGADATPGDSSHSDVLSPQPDGTGPDVAALDAPETSDAVAEAGDRDGDVIDDGGVPETCSPEQIVAAIDEARIRDTVAALTALPERTTHAGQLEAEALLIDQLEAEGVTVSSHEYSYFGATYANLVIEMVGTELPDQIYSIGAHFDSTSSTPSDAPGADDNAAGAAAVAEIARVLSSCSFPATVRVLLFSNEEVGAVGSQRYAQDAADRGDDIRGFYALDMIAYGGPDEDLDIATKPSSAALAHAAVAANDSYVGMEVVANIDDQCG